MIIRFETGKRIQLSPRINSIQFECPCESEDCTFGYADTSLLNGLEKLSFPFRINSGFRCTHHNQEIGGKPGSYHLLGKAADISSELTGPAMKVQAEAQYVFLFGGIGIGSDFIHLDSRGYASRWTYPIKETS